MTVFKFYVIELNIHSQLYVCIIAIDQQCLVCALILFLQIYFYFMHIIYQ